MRNSENILARTFGCARYMYNWGLRLRTDAFYEHQQRIGYAGTCKLLTALLRNTEPKLARAQRCLSRKQKGSKNRAKAKAKVARVHTKLADQRRDWQHKLTTKIVHENQVISVERLKIKNRVKNPCLSKSIPFVGGPGDSRWSRPVAIARKNYGGTRWTLSLRSLSQSPMGPSQRSIER